MSASGGRRDVGARVSGVVLLCLLAALALPVAWAVGGSLVKETALFEGRLWSPDAFTLDHYRALFDQRDFWVPIRNSLIVAGATTLLCVTLGSLAAYALVRLPFRGRSVLLAGVLALSMFPQIAIVSPLFLLLRELGLINTYPGLVLPYLTFAMPISLWLLVGYFRQLPIELEQAAALDGAGRLRTLFEVVLPLAAPGLAATAILTFLYCWNEFLFALSFTLGPDRHTVPVAITLFRGEYRIPWGQVMAAAVVATAPVAALVLVAQKRITQGLTVGAVKG